MGDVRLGLIGCGKVVEVFHLPALAALEGVRVVAVMDTDPSRADAVGAALGLPPGRRLADHRRLLDLPDIDAVSIGTPPASHREIAVDAAASGRHIICEKPMAVSVADADAMIAAARRAGVLLSLHHNYLWFPENRAAQEVIAGGRLGRLVFSVIDCLGLPYFGGRWRLHDPHVSGGGILLDMLHLIYLTNAFHDGLPRRVDARIARIREEPIRVEDFATVRLEYPGGGLGQVNVSWGLGWGGTRLMGTRGRLIYHYRHFTTVNYERPDALRLITAEGEVDVPFPPAPPFSAGPFRQFVEAVRGARPLEVTGEDGRTAVEVALAGYRAAALGEPTDLPLPPEDPVYIHGVAGLHRVAGAAPAVVDLFGPRV
ncbi:MAG: Gfo/Idh/MocA family oxidoreductase [Armatimonadota bacterium]|nr:Gfo/Idh/MocA family oxidoreductase [Armatimonadota bacterium]MDR7422438.1 Gfo/Idh/MocA family oxidoreductase [Armatimonadota bacterium]MDR7454410.1 Gfo/Idh/MocA family oxidoreductase [Armatimonadota bacterium]MDR7457076.1 Gfo/Idh/MocA family oxidoreductase [Armatimonadota bacterium]MDR7496940.1 Gfo/Idh/MocA family oxidoreductase [Armatimonadota bacterium]